MRQLDSLPVSTLCLTGSPFLADPGVSKFRFPALAAFGLENIGSAVMYLLSPGEPFFLAAFEPA